MLAHSPTRSLATCPNPLGSGLRLRGSQARKNGIEYDVIIDEGSLGLEVVNLMVTGIMPGGQAEAKGVLAGSKILGINGRRCKDDVGFAGLLAMVPRPFKLLLGKVRTPRALAGDVFVLEGTLAKGKRWRARRAEVDGTTNTLSFSADGSSKKEKKGIPGMKSLRIPSSENMTGFSDTSRPNFSHACHLLNIFLYLSITFCCKA